MVKLMINDWFKINICIGDIKTWLQVMFKLLFIFYLIYLALKMIINDDEMTSQNVGIAFTYSVAIQE